MSDKKNRKLSGGLYFALLSGITALLVTIYGLKNTILPFSFDEKWKVISNINLDSYNKPWMDLVKSEFIGNIFFLIFITLIFYFQTVIKGPLPPTFNEIIRSALTSVIFIGIWIPYFLLSDRVRETFIN